MPATIGWRRRDEDGLIVTWDLPNGAETVPMLPAEQWKTIEAVEAKWGPLCRDIGAKYLLPDGWLQAMIWRESGGNELAFRREPKRRNEVEGWTGVGLLQVTHPSLKGRHKVQVGTVEINGKVGPLWKWEGGRSDAEVFVPRVNLTIAAKYAAELASRPVVKGDFARTAAAFNSGGVYDSSDNPFGMHSTGNHIDQEVRALNTWTYLQLKGEQFFAAQAIAKQFNLQDTLESGHVTLKDDEPPDTPRNT